MIEAQPGPARMIGSPQSYSELIDLLFERKNELNLGDRALDDIIDWAPGYTQKVLGPAQVKRLSGLTLFDILGGLGLSIALFDDPKKRCHNTELYAPRNNSKIQMLAKVSMRVINRARPEIMRQFGKANAVKGNRARNLSLSPKKRSRLAKRAALVRWRKPRLVEIKGEARKRFLAGKPKEEAT